MFCTCDKHTLLDEKGDASIDLMMIGLEAYNYGSVILEILFDIGYY